MSSEVASKKAHSKSGFDRKPSGLKTMLIKCDEASQGSSQKEREESLEAKKRDIGITPHMNGLQRAKRVLKILKESSFLQ